MGLRVTLHIHNNVRANRNNLVLGVGLHICQSLPHQISGVALVLERGVNFGMDKVSFTGHQRVIGKADSLFF